MKQRKRTTGKRTKLPTKPRWGLVLDPNPKPGESFIKFKCDVCGCTDERDLLVCPECNSTVKLTTERGNQHGDWIKQSSTAQRFKQVVRDSYNYHAAKLSDSQLEAVEMICVKLSRILTGDPNHEDHWIDIQGYVELIKISWAQRSDK